MNCITKIDVKSSRTAVITGGVIALILLAFSSANAQVRPPGRITTQTATAQQLKLPDLGVMRVYVSGNQDEGHLTVVITGRVTTPFKVWLRIWKPTDAKSAEGPTSGKNSFLWGGTATVNGESGKAKFIVPTAPPGGWQTYCAAVVGCHRTKESLADPLRWRLTVEVDSTNLIKESNEANNSYVG